ncbi:PDZ domain-containing protein [bacterium]|nr:PDZ domain-containing protein [bacterium]
MTKILVTFTALFLSLQLIAAPLTPEEKTLDFMQLIGRMKSGYGPLNYKKQTQGIDVDVLQEKYLKKIQESKTNDEFYYLISQFISEFRDSHFVAEIPTEASAKLPFYVDLVEDKVIIESVNTDLVDEDKFSFKKGDELIAIDGKPVAEIIKSLLPYVGEGYEKTQKRFATWMITSRKAERVPLVEGKSLVTIKLYGRNTTKTEIFNWKVVNENPLEMLTAFRPTSFLQKLSIKEKIKDFLTANKKSERSYMCSGESRIEIPIHATIVSEKPFVSYYWPTPKGNIGYVRIGHFYPEDEAKWASSNLDAFFLRYEKVISIMEKNTVGLIIDQDHNCGGYVDLGNKMLGLFMQQAYKPIQFSLVASKENYLEYKKMADSIDPLASMHDQVQAVADIVKDSWVKGERMTPLVSLNGEDFLQPNFVRYTKPIIMLIDEMSASCGDAFPVMMKGLGRAKLLGTRTMGAGGHVDENPPLNYSQIAVSMTRSMFFRPDGTPVENNGAEPDYPYNITLDDFVNGYKGYRNFYTEKILELVK